MSVQLVDFVWVRERKWGETFIQSKGRWGMFAAIKGRFTNSLHQCRTLFYCYKEESLDFLKHYSAYVFVGVARSVLRASRAFFLGIVFLLFADDLVLLTSRKHSLQQQADVWSFPVIRQVARMRAWSHGCWKMVDCSFWFWESHCHKWRS